MRKTRVLQVIPDLGMGGAERMLLNLVGNLDRERYDLAVISFFDAQGTANERELATSGIPTFHLGKRLGFDARMFPRIRGVLREWLPDVVHTHRAALQYVLGAVSGPLRRRVLHTVHTVATRETGTAGRMANWLAFRVGVAPVAICGFIARSITRSYGVVPRAIIPNGIPVARFARPPQSREEWRRANAIAESAVVFTCVARLAAPKNISVLLEAFAALDRRDCILVLAGDGPLRAQLEGEARSRGLTGSVRFLGRRLDVPELLAASDAFVLPSSWEGYPLSIMEAMAAGRAVIATNVGGVPELVRHNETGLIVPSNDVGGLASAMRGMAERKDLRERLGRDAGRFAAKALDVSRMATQYDALYQALVKPARGTELP